MVKGVRCDGVYQSRVNPAGWRERPACLATGCTVCGGIGWFAIRPLCKSTVALDWSRSSGLSHRGEADLASGINAVNCSRFPAVGGRANETSAPR